MSDREELERKIRKAEEEMRRAGPIHKKDLAKYIERLRRELKRTRA